MGAAHTTRSKDKMDSSNSNTRGKNEGQASASSSVRPLSIEGPPNSENSAQAALPAPNQPRQPSNLQGLLRYAVEAGDTQDGNPDPPHFQPMDEERKQFLKETIASLTVNVIEELQKAIKVLSNVVDLRPEDDASQHEAALEAIADYVDNIDIANDFYKVGGFAIFGPCLNSPHSSIRWRTADVIAELAQNNPYCQERVLETGLFPILLKMVDTDPAEAVRIKALYAVSCIVRENPTALKHMEANDGYSVLLRAMQSSVQKLQIKSAFLLSSLCNIENRHNLKLTLVNMGLIEQAAGLLAMNSLSPEIRDQLINILGGLTNEDFLPALRECRRPELCLKATLERCIKDLKQEESVDEVDVCVRIMEKAFADQDISQDR